MMLVTFLIELGRIRAHQAYNKSGWNTLLEDLALLYLLLINDKVKCRNRTIRLSCAIALLD